MNVSDKEFLEKVLAAPMQRNDAGASTVREYLQKLLLELWREGECFSGKRPFGNSGWEYEIYTALLREELVLGRLDHYEKHKEYIYGVDWVDDKQANEVITRAIEYVFSKK